jgi:hypothetical protein
MINLIISSYPKGLRISLNKFKNIRSNLKIYYSLSLAQNKLNLKG